MAKRATWLVLVMGVIMIASACSSGGGGVGAECDGTIDQNTIEVWVHEGTEADAYEALVDAFNASGAGVTVQLTKVPEGGYTDTVNAAAAAGDLPDVIDFDGPTLANFAWGGTIVHMDDCIDDELKDNLLPSIVEGGTYEGNLYSVGTFDSGLGIYAWRSALEEVGARIPTTPDDAWTVEETEKVLVDLQNAGYAMPLDIKIHYGTQGEWMTYGFSPITQSAGSDLIDRGSLKADGVLNSEEVVTALTVFQDWANRDLINTETVDDTPFLDKTTPLSWVGHWMYTTYKETLGDDLVVVPLPDFGDGTKTGMGSWAWAITSSNTDGDAAWEFIKFAMEDSTILTITEANGAVPATKTALAQNPNYAEGGDLYMYRLQLEGAPDIAVPRPVTPGYPTVTSEFWTAMDKILLGEDVKTSLDTAVAAIDADVDANEGYPAP